MRLDIRRKCFVQRVVRCCNKFPREAVGAPTLEVPMARLDGAPIWWGALGWSRVGFKVTSNPTIL